MFHRQVVDLCADAFHTLLGCLSEMRLTLSLEKSKFEYCCLTKKNSNKAGVINPVKYLERCAMCNYTATRNYFEQCANTYGCSYLLPVLHYYFVYITQLAVMVIFSPAPYIWVPVSKFMPKAIFTKCELSLVTLRLMLLPHIRINALTRTTTHCIMDFWTWEFGSSLSFRCYCFY